MTEIESAVDRLNAVPLEDFVAERKRLAKELRDAGDREAATELAKLPKPSAPAWALNHLAREEPQAVGAWLDAAGALREASLNADRSSGDALRAAMATHREATRGLLAAVRERTRPNGRELSEPMLDRVRELLQAATADPDAAERLRAGRAAEPDDDVAPPPPDKAALTDRAKSRAAEADASTDRTKSRAAGERASDDRTKAADEAGASTERASKARAAEERAAKERAAREADARAELERLVAATERRLDELREVAADAESAAATAGERLEEAERTLHRSESEAAAARQAADEATAAAEQAERELRALAAKLSS